MMTIAATSAWREAHPGAAIGLLELAGVEQAGPPARLEERKRATEALLRERYAGWSRQDLLAIPVMAAYHRYYRRFKKTYHVQLQVESIAFKGRNLPSVTPLVDANYCAEVDTLILTAGHDVDRLREPVQIDVSVAGDRQTQMSGEPKEILAGDMVMRDAGGISCSIIYGQDHRSPITPETTHALYVAYAPAGVPAEEVERQLRAIEVNVRLFSPAAVLEQLTVIRA
jgi:DNA/RNA-binding domain of Phe-tRNA-synthetase-like protein